MDMRDYRLGYDRLMRMTRFLLASIVLACCAAGAIAQAQQPAIAVTDVWARPTVQGQTTGGGYLRIQNKGSSGDRLLHARSSVAAGVELHTMTMDGGVMRMRRVESIDIPAAGVVELKPGGLHLMLTGLKEPLSAGTPFPLTLTFEKAGAVEVQGTVAAPGHHRSEHGHKH
jgi:copper(I)-binding protein